MRDARNRDMMVKMYRIVEKYEEVPITRYSDIAIQWFGEASRDISKLYDEYKDNAIARSLLIALYDALGERFKEVNKMPLVDKDKEPKQLTIDGLDW